MEYIIMISIALAVFFILFLIIKVEKIRNRANALFLEAEKHVDSNKLQYVCNNLYSYIPGAFRLFINEQLFTEIVQMIYDHTRHLAKDLLDDGKLNKSYK